MTTFEAWTLTGQWVVGFGQLALISGGLVMMQLAGRRRDRTLDEGIARARAAHEETMAALAEERAASEKRHEEAMTASEKRHEEAMAASEKRHAEAMAALEKRHEEVMSASEKRHAEAMAESERKHEETMRKHDEAMVALTELIKRTGSRNYP